MLLSRKFHFRDSKISMLMMKNVGKFHAFPFYQVWTQNLIILSVSSLLNESFGLGKIDLVHKCTNIQQILILYQYFQIWIDLLVGEKICRLINCRPPTVECTELDPDYRIRLNRRVHRKEVLEKNRRKINFYVGKEFFWKSLHLTEFFILLK